MEEEQQIIEEASRMLEAGAFDSPFSPDMAGASDSPFSPDMADRYLEQEMAQEQNAAADGSDFSSLPPDQPYYIPTLRFSPNGNWRATEYLHNFVGPIKTDILDALRESKLHLLQILQQYNFRVWLNIGFLINLVRIENTEERSIDQYFTSTAIILLSISELDKAFENITSELLK